VPDFAFAGPGVRVDDIVPGSPAEKAGLRKGDVLLKLAGQPIESLRGYSQILGTLAPEQTIEIEIERDGARQTFSVTVVAR
jgi:S1-C subfamily serine protease